MKLQMKNKKYLLILVLFFLTSCSSSVSQEIFEDGKSTILILIEDVDENRSICQNFDSQLEFFDESCKNNGNSLEIKGSHYLNQYELELKENLFSTEYSYDLSSLEVLLKSLATSIYGEYTNEELDITIYLSMPGSFQEHPFSEEQGILTFSNRDFPINKKIVSKKYNLLPITIFITLSISIFLIGRYVVKKRESLFVSEPKSLEISQEELKCKQYILQFKSQYSKEVLFQGLVNSGISKEKAQYYINKYFIF